MRMLVLVRPCSGVVSYAEFDVHSCPTCRFRIPFGDGKRFSIFWPRELIRPGGMMLPGNCTPVCGSMIGRMLPFVCRVCEKSPPRSAAVGRFTRRVVVGRLSIVYSCDT